MVPNARTASAAQTQPWQFIAILSGCVPEQGKVPLTWENVGVEANILL